MLVERCKKLQTQYLQLWKNLHGWKFAVFYMIHYTVLFWLLWNVVFFPFVSEGKTFLYTTDGIEAHFPRLLYISQKMRECIKSLLTGGGWTYPMYDFQLGLVTQDLQIGFPQILSVFWRPSQMGQFYQFYVTLVYYLIGASFSYFGFYFKQKSVAVLTGAVAYTFCGYSLYAGVIHPHFAFPMCILPLLIVGAEKVLRKERSYLLLIAVFLSLTTQWGLYFSCIQAILVVLYCAVRFFDLYQRDLWQEGFRFLGRLCVWGGTGALLAMFVAIPALLSIVGIDRVGRDISVFTNYFAYSQGYYKAFLSRFILIPGNMGSWTCLGFSVLAIPAVFLLFVRRQRAERSLKILFALLTVMLYIPAVGYVMSGFSAVSNRFCFGYAFCVAAIIMFMLPHFAQADRKQQLIVGMLVLGYIAVCFSFGSEKYRSAPVVLLLLTVLVLALCRAGGQKWAERMTAVCLVISMISSGYSAYLMYDQDQMGLSSQYVEDPVEYMEQSQYHVLGMVPQVRQDPDFFRVAGSSLRRGDSNTSFYYGLNGLSMYPYFGWSGAYMDWVAENELARYGNKHVLLGLNSHLAMLTLANCKYFVLRSGWQHPYGFAEVTRYNGDSGLEVILENNHWLPLGYTYDRYITREQYDALGALAKQEAQLQAVVLEQTPALESIRQTEVTATAHTLPYTVVEKDGVDWRNGILEVSKNGAGMRVKINKKADGITYLRMVGLDLTDGASSRMWTLTAYDETTKAKAAFQADGYEYTTGQYTQMLDLGYGTTGESIILIRFPQAGTYRLEDIQVWNQPMDDYAAQVKKLGEETLQNIETDWRSLRGTVSVSKDKMLCIALPWVDGWSAYVDGERVPLYRANTAFMALELAQGDHTVELRYMLPGLVPGAALSAAGLLCLAAVIWFDWKGRRRE